MIYEKKNDRVILLGTASSLSRAPFSHPGFDWWACSPVITHSPADKKKMDLLFEMHGESYYLSVKDRLNAYDAPIYMQSQNSFIKNSITYPLKEVQSMVSSGRFRKYFTSTIAYMIALAIYMQYDEIHLYGVHMAAEEEYGDQRQACEAWIGVAEGRGIQVVVAEESQLFRNQFLYGYEQENNVSTKIRLYKNGLKNGLTKLNESLEDAKKKVWMQEGAISNCDYFIREFNN